MAINPSLTDGIGYSRTHLTAKKRPQKGLNKSSAMLIAGLLPFTQLIELKLVGTLFLQDLIAVFLLPILLAITPQARKLLKPLKLFLLLALVWLAGAILTDFLVESAFEDLARGWSKILLYAIHAVVLWLLSRGNLTVLAIYLVASGFSYGVKALVLPSELAEADPWKFGVGIGLLLIASSLSAIFSRKWFLVRQIPIILTLLVGTLSLLLNSRSLFAIALLSVLYTVGASFLSNRLPLQRFINRGSFLLIIILGLLFSQLMSAGYGELASRGTLGEAARTKYVAQTAGNMSLLQGGRPESLVSIQAIKDSPFIGHGSWAKDRYYTNMYFNELKWRGLVVESQWIYFDRDQKDIIPSHSHLLGSWVESGILGAPIWIYSIILAFEALYVVIKLRSIPSLMVIATAFFLIWDVLFSPFGAEGRMLKAAQICVLISISTTIRTLTSKTSNTKDSQRGSIV